MPPALLNDVVNRRLTCVERLRNPFEWPAELFPFFSRKQHLTIGKSVVPVSFSWGTCIGRQSVLLRSIFHVVLMRALEKVIRVAARRVVASVEHENLARQIKPVVVKAVHQPVSIPVFSEGHDLTIPALGNGSRPRPAGIWSSDSNGRPQSFANWCVIHAHVLSLNFFPRSVKFFA
jgi:hypothetical protein